MARSAILEADAYGYGRYVAEVVDDAQGEPAERNRGKWYAHRTIGETGDSARLMATFLMMGPDDWGKA